jgi:hypothetical protein
MFRNMDLFPSSGEGRETPTLLGPLWKVNLNHCTTRRQSHITTDDQSVSRSVYRGLESSSGTCDQILLAVRVLMSEGCCLVFVGAPSLTRGQVCLLLVSACNNLSECMINIYTS